MGERAIHGITWGLVLTAIKTGEPVNALKGKVPTSSEKNGKAPVCPDRGRSGGKEECSGHRNIPNRSGQCGQSTSVARASIFPQQKAAAPKGCRGGEGRRDPTPRRD